MLSKAASQIRGHGFSIGMVACALAAQVVWASPAWSDMTPYPKMAALAQYLSPDQATEVALARAAGPASISGKADIMVLSAHGYETVVKGSNGFVCYVGRSWEADLDHPEFWNPKIRAPTCANAAAVRSHIPYYLELTQWVLSGVSLDEMTKRTKAEVTSGKIKAPEAGAMAFMLSKDQYVGDNQGGPSGGQFYPHVMFWGPPGPASDWGANLPGAPILSQPSDIMPLTMYYIPVRKWSDGSLYPYPASTQAQPAHHHG